MIDDKQTRFQKIYYNGGIVSDFTKEDIPGWMNFKGGICTIAYVNAEGKLCPGGHRACHSNLGSLKTGSKELYTSCWSRQVPTLTEEESTKVCKLWFDLCLDPVNSPWRTVLKDFERHEGYVHFKDLNVSAQVLANLCIALRVPYEREYKLILLHKLMNDGRFTPNECIYLASVFEAQISYTTKGPVLTSKVIASATYGGHYFVNDASPMPFSRFNSGSPVVNGKNMSDGEQHRFPTNAIWQGLGVDLKSLLSGNKPYTGSFTTYNVPVKGFVSMDYEAFVKKVLETERDKW